MPRKLQSNLSNVSFARLRNIQKLLEDTETDCLLCIQGIDSRYNEGMQECSNYLLLGLFESYRQDLLSTGSDDDIIDDLILCVKAHSVEVYCNPVNYPHLLPYIAAWPDLHVHCLSETQFESDTDASEEFKIKCFVSMVSKCKHVAVPYFPKQHLGISTFDKMKVEQWPIIQAYALEDVGSGTFFTLLHDVTDVSSSMSTVSEKFDALSTELLIMEQLPIFERQWDCLGKTVDVARMSKFGDGFTETNAVEPLVTYFKHGRVGSDHQLDEASLWQQPFCYMGVQTKNLTKDGGRVLTVVDITTASVGACPALHMVCHGVDPRSGLVCTRTYFFGSSSLPPLLGNNDEYRNPDVQQLSRAYRMAIEVTLKSINDYAVSLQPSQIIENAKLDVVSGLQKFMDCRQLEIVVKLETKLLDGRLVEVKDGAVSECIMTMSVVINNIHSPQDQKQCLGAVAHSDSFLVSVIRSGGPSSGPSSGPVSETVSGQANGQASGQASGQAILNSEVLILTQNVSRWESWNISKECADFISNIEQLLGNNNSGDMQRLAGELLVNGQTVEVVSPQAWLQPITCTLYLYSQAVVLMSDSLGPIILTKGDLKSAHFYDGGGPSVPAFVTLYTSMDIQTKLPIQLYNTSRILVISLNPRTKAYQQFFERVFEAWKVQEGSSFALDMKDTLPTSLQIIHEKAAARFKSQISRPLSIPATRRLQAQECHLFHYQRFLKHIAVSANLPSGQAVAEKDIHTLLGSSSTELVEDNSHIMLTISILSGVPGSYKENLANFITKLTQERSSIGKGWVIHKQTPETNHYFDVGKLESSLSYVYSVLKKKSNSAAKSSRMLVITPGFTDIETVVNAITNHPNKELLRHVRIGAVTTCVDPHSSFISGHHTVPGLLNQCAQGWVNNVVLTNSSDHQNNNLAKIQSLIRAVNPAVNFILANRGELTRSQDIELILSDSAFEQQELARSRLLRQCRPKPSCESYGMNTVVLEFTQPLIKQKLLVRFRDLHTSVSQSVEGPILHVVGRAQFTDADKIFDISYSPLSNSSKITPTQLKPADKVPPMFMSFVGFSLSEPALKDLLRSCVPPKPEKKDYLSIKSLDQKTKHAIHKEKHLEPLPAGWFYNGSQYVDMSGEKTDRHPEFDRFLQEYVDIQNELVREVNAQVDRTDYHDMFE